MIPEDIDSAYAFADVREMPSAALKQELSNWKRAAEREVKSKIPNYDLLRNWLNNIYRRAGKGAAF